MSDLSAIVIASEPAASSALALPADPEKQLVDMWLHGLSKHTQRAYRRDFGLFRSFTDHPLREITLAQVQAFAVHVGSLPLVPGSRHRILSAVKSLFAFATRIGYLQYDVARPLRMPACRETLSDRILDEDEVRRLIVGELNARNHLLLRLLYNAGLRVSELTSLTWSDAQAHRGGGQLTVFGKGNKTRIIRIEGAMWTALIASRGDAGLSDPIFISGRKGGGRISNCQVARVVRAAARRAGIDKPVSPHWLRHCHCSHALDRGAPIHLVQQTVGHSSVATTSRYLHARPSESSARFIPSV